MTVTKLKYLILLFLFVPLMAQVNVAKRYNQINAQYSTKLDGSTQYWTNTLANQMSINGVEMIGSPGVIISVEDGNISTYSIVAPICLARGIKLTVYIISDKIGTSGYMTEAQLLELYAAGVDVANHTRDHTNLATLTEEQQEAEFADCAAYLDNLGMTRASHHCGFPGTSGGGDTYNADTFTAMAATGMLTSFTSGTTFINPLDYNPYLAPIWGLGADYTNPGAVEIAIMRAMSLGNFLHPAVDDVNDAAHYWFNTQEFTELCDWIVANQIPTYTISESYPFADNRGFEIGSGDWANGGNHSCSRVTDYKKSGNGALKIVSTDVGDGTTNYISLPASKITIPIVSGLQYTFELWAYGDANGVTLTMKVGDQIVAEKVVYSAVAGTYTRQTFNFLATGNTINQPIRLYLSSAGNCWIDNISLTQAFDAVIIANISTVFDAAGGSRGIFGIETTNGNPRYNLIQSTDNKLMSLIADGTSLALAYSKTAMPITGDAISVAVTIERCGSIKNYLNGSVGDPVSATSCGKITVNQASTRSGTVIFNGKINWIQVLRFPTLPADIASTISQIKITGKPLLVYPTGQIVGWWDWKQGGYDKSGNGNHLTNIGSAPIVRVK